MIVRRTDARLVRSASVRALNAFDARTEAHHRVGRLGAPALRLEVRRTEAPYILRNEMC